MHLSELKSKHVSELIEVANANEIEGANRMRKHDLIFALLKQQAKKGESIFGGGVLEVLPDGFGFLRSPDTSLSRRTPTTSTSRRRRSAASTCTPATRSKARSARRRTASATSRWSRSTRSTSSRPRTRRSKILFENLTPLFPDEPMVLERDIKAEENITGRIIDIVAPIGKGQRGLLVASPEVRQDGHAAAHRALDRRQSSRT